MGGHQLFRHSLILWACIAVQVAACGPKSSAESRVSSVGGSGTDAGASPLVAGGSTGATAHQWPQVTSAPEFLNAVAQAYCERLFKCRRVSDDDVSLTSIYRTVENCVALQREANVRLPERLELVKFVSTGEVLLNLSQVGPCLDEIASCEMPSIRIELTNDWPACRSVFYGTVANGSACLRNEQCSADSYCDTTECPGVCSPKVAEGASCSEDYECATASGYTMCMGTCHSHSVGTPAGPGGRCQSYGSGISELIPCGPGLWCDDHDSSPGTCRSPIPNGESCYGDSAQCELGSACSNKICTKVTYEVAGAATNDWTTFCDEGYVAVNKTCVVAGNGSNGSICGGPSGFPEHASLRGCQTGLYCNENVCEAPKATGESCVGYEQCQEGNCVITDRSNCVSFRSCVGTCSNAETCLGSHLVVK
jgi:hypothetical protein